MTTHDKHNPENSRRSSWWPVPIGAALVVLLAWMLVETIDWNRSEPLNNTDATEQAAVLPAPVGKFITYVGDEETSFEEDSLHAHTATALRQLTGAIEALGAWDEAEGLNFDAKRDTLLFYASQLEQKPHTEHARYVSNGLALAADLLTELQRHRYPGLNGTMAEIRQIAMQIGPSEDLSSQHDLIQDYFSRSRSLFEDIRHLEVG